MLRNIEVLQPSCPPASGQSQADVEQASRVIKRSVIDRGQQAFDVLADAQAHAAELIALAEQDAVALRSAGFREGLQTGMCAALAAIPAMVSQWNQVRLALREDAQAGLRASIADLATRQPTLIALLESVLDVHLPEQTSKVRIRVPIGAETEALQAQCKTLGLVASVETGEARDEFSISWNGHVWTAHLGEIVESALSTHTQKVGELPDVDAAEICRQALLDVADTLSEGRVPEQT